MTNKFLISVGILCVVLTTRGNTQGAAQAVMNVNVTIVKANKAEVPPAVQFQLPDSSGKKKNNELVSFIISDMSITDGYLQFPDKVVLFNEEGEEIQFAVKTSKKTLKGKSLYSIRVLPHSKASFSGNYRGNYKVSMVYQ